MYSYEYKDDIIDEVEFWDYPEILIRNNNIIMNNKFDFFTSTRFWALVIGAISIYCKAKGWLGPEEMNLIATLSVGFIGIKTVDKNLGEAKIQAAGVTSGQVDAADVTSLPPTE